MGKITLFETKGVWSQTCSQSHTQYTFFAEEDLYCLYIQLTYDRTEASEENAEALVLGCIDQFTTNYSRETAAALKQNYKQFGGLKSLVTISLDDNNGFRGASHRGREKVLVKVTPEAASEGYTKGVIPKGTISVTLSVHSLTGDCPYHLLVETEDTN